MLCAAGNGPTPPNAGSVHELGGYRAGEPYGGSVGLGAIGKAMAVRLRAFEMQVLAYDPFVTQEDASKVGATLVPLNELMRRSDFVSMHVHVTSDTRAMIELSSLR